LLQKNFLKLNNPNLSHQLGIMKRKSWLLSLVKHVNNKLCKSLI
jgi:hypothetical protein